MQQAQVVLRCEASKLIQVDVALCPSLLGPGRRALSAKPAQGLRAGRRRPEPRGAARADRRAVRLARRRRERGLAAHQDRVPGADAGREHARRARARAGCDQPAVRARPGHPPPVRQGAPLPVVLLGRALIGIGLGFAARGPAIRALSVQVADYAAGSAPAGCHTGSGVIARQAPARGAALRCSRPGAASLYLGAFSCVPASDHPACGRYRPAQDHIAGLFGRRCRAGLVAALRCAHLRSCIPLPGRLARTQCFKAHRVTCLTST